MLKVLHIIKSPSFETDGRLQKWVKQLYKRGFHSTVFIVEDGNKNTVENFYENTVKKQSLFFRKYFKQRSGYLFKIPEYLKKTSSYICEFEGEIIVFHDVQQYLNLFFHLISNKNRTHKVVWDLHELPHNILLNNFAFRPFLRFLLNNVDAVVYTNVERREYIKDHLKGLKEKRFFILNNYPDSGYINSDFENVDIETFDNSKPYILWLGAGIETRNFGAFLRAYKRVNDQFNLVVIGNIDPKFEDELGVYRSENKLFNKFVNQSDIKKYIDNSFLSVVLYNTSSANNLLCEPNRLYQLVSRDIPVVVGNNPTMANLINKLEVGVVLRDDGSSSDNIYEGMQRIIDNYRTFKSISQSKNYSELFSWEKQIDEIIDFIIG